MDQDSFRKLLQTPRASSSGTPSSRGSLLAAATTKPNKKVVDTGQPAFKPRTVKKKPQGSQHYRDRASERRLGTDNDYAEIEALAEDFERRNAENADRKAVEEQRRYLGGDSAHSVIVKGLDIALLEQNRVRMAASAAAEADVSLEQAYLEAAPSVPKKRTREEIIQELKAKRAKGEIVDKDNEKNVTVFDASLEEAKKSGKFKPIGFKPIGESNEKPKRKKSKKAEGKEKGESKKQKTDVPAAEASVSLPPTAQEAGPSEPIPASLLSATIPEPQPEPFDEDFDIFTGAGEYTGVEITDEEESEEEMRSVEARPGVVPEGQLSPKGGWFATEEEKRSPSPKPPHPPPSALSGHREEEEEEEELPMHLQPLTSSVIPSVRELLEMDAAVSKANRWRGKKKNKEKQVAGEGKISKDKVERDYQRLKAYTEKKAAAR